MNLKSKDIRKYLPAAAFLVAVAYQIHCIIHGFDPTDEGFLMSLYQSFGSDINACKGGAGYPLTCFLGYLCNTAFPSGGLLWMRICGVTVVCLTFIASFKILKDAVPSNILLPALLCQVFIVSSDPKPFGYNTLSAAAALAVVALCINGIKRNKNLPLVLGGAVAALAFYLRLPNISFAAFAMLPFADNGLSRQSFKQASAFIAGYLISAAAFWLMMTAIGADRLILDFFASLGSTLNGESTHSSGSMLLTMLGNYGKAILLLILFCASILLMSLNKSRFLSISSAIAVAAAYYYILYTHSGTLADNQTALLNGIGLGGCIYLIIRTPRFRLLAVAATLMALLCPFGSDKGFVTVWTGTWLAFPAGLLGIKLFFEGTHPADYRKAFAFMLLLLCFCSFLKTEKRAYYDGRPKTRKTSIIDSPYARGIKTTEHRAEIINGLLHQMKALGVKEGDTILVYSSSPIVYYLTGTKPFAGISWPCLQFGEQYERSFQKAVQDGVTPSMIIIQHFNNLGTAQEWKEPSWEIMSSSYGWEMATAGMNRTVKSFIQDHSYQKVWSNKYYDIYL